MPAITFTGISSGIDSSALITQLVAYEKRPAVLLQSQQSDLASHKSIVDNLANQVSTLGTLANHMALASDLQFRTATATDTHVAVAASGRATATTHAVRVLQTARAQVSTSRAFATDEAGMLGAGSVDIQTGAGTPVNVAWDATDTLETIASKINDTAAGTRASVLFDGASYRLVLSAKQTGTANAPTFTDSGDGLALADPTNIKVPGKDAQVSIDGITITRPTNVITDAIAGVTITAVSAQAATDPDTDVAIAVDHSAAAAQLGSFVSDYNAITSSINAQLTYTGTTAGTSTLFGDSTMRQLKSALSQLATGQFNGTSLSDLGIEIDKTGVMSLDRTKLDTAIAGNQDAVGALFVDGGLTHAVQGLVRGYTAPGDGILVAKSKSYTTLTSSLQGQIDRINKNASVMQSRLEAQFTALEQTMSRLNSQTTYISKILAG